MPLFVNYDSAADAARVTVPAFSAELSLVFDRMLGAPMSATDTTLTLADGAQMPGDSQRTYKIGDEILLQPVSTSSSDRVRPVLRAQRGTVAAAHPAGALVMAASNSLPNGLKIPIDMEDGHTYLITWDALWTDGWRYPNSGLSGNKSFQITADGKKWLEVKTQFDGAGRAGFDPTRHVASVEARLYNTILTPPQPDWSLTNGNAAGPNVSADNLLAPKTGTFFIKPNVWTRFWWVIEQRVNDYDLISLWVADEQTDPVLLFNRLQASARPPEFSMDGFWVEFNDSQVALGPNRTGDLIAYVRNLAILEDPRTPIPDLLLPPK